MKKIEKYNRRGKVHGNTIYPFASLEVGEGFFETCDMLALTKVQASLGPLCRYWGKKLGRRFATRRDREYRGGGVWVVRTS